MNREVIQINFWVNFKTLNISGTNIYEKTAYPYITFRTSFTKVYEFTDLKTNLLKWKIIHLQSCVRVYITSYEHITIYRYAKSFMIKFSQIQYVFFTISFEPIKNEVNRWHTMLVVPIWEYTYMFI